MKKLINYERNLLKRIFQIEIKNLISIDLNLNYYYNIKKHRRGNKIYYGQRYRKIRSS